MENAWVGFSFVFSALSKALPEPTLVHEYQQSSMQDYGTYLSTHLGIFLTKLRGKTINSSEWGIGGEGLV